MLNCGIPVYRLVYNSSDQYWSLVRSVNVLELIWPGTRRYEVDGTKKKYEAVSEEDSYARALQREVGKLSDNLSKCGDTRQGEEKKCKKRLLSRCKCGERCPANTRKCKNCAELGRYSRSTLSMGKGKEKEVRKVQED